MTTVIYSYKLYLTVVFESYWYKYVIKVIKDPLIKPALTSVQIGNFGMCSRHVTEMCQQHCQIFRIVLGTVRYSFYYTVYV